MYAPASRSSGARSRSSRESPHVWDFQGSPHVWDFQGSPHVWDFQGSRLHRSDRWGRGEDPGSGHPAPVRRGGGGRDARVAIIPTASRMPDTGASYQQVFADLDRHALGADLNAAASGAVSQDETNPQLVAGGVGSIRIRLRPFFTPRPRSHLPPSSPLVVDARASTHRAVPRFEAPRTRVNALHHQVSPSVTRNEPGWRDVCYSILT